MARKKQPSLAEILHSAYRAAVGEFLTTWDELPEDARKHWEAAADAAEEWARENIAWEE